MENEYTTKQESGDYQPRPSPEFIARAEEIIRDPNTKWISLDEFLKKAEGLE